MEAAHSELGALAVRLGWGRALKAADRVEQPSDF